MRPAPDESPATSATVADTQTFQTTELDLPESTAGIVLLLGGLAAVIAITVRTSLRDSRFLRKSSRIILLVPRLILAGLLLMIILNPQQRTQLSRVEQSRVGVLVDTSLSMKWPAGDPPSAVESAAGTQGAATVPPAEDRTSAVVRGLIDSGVLNELSRTHAVSVYTFDTSLKGPWAIVSDEHVRFVTPEQSDAGAVASPGESSTVVDLQTLSDDGIADRLMTDPAVLAEWNSILQASGAETRLGEALYQLIGQLSGRTLSGVVVLSDGSSNAGLGNEPARLRAERTQTRLFPVGVGGLKALPNLWIAGMQSPADVHKGDPFDINVSVQGSGTAGQSVTVRLFQQTAEGDGQDRRQVAEQTITAGDDALPISVHFAQALAVPGKYEFSAEVTAPAGIAEMTLEDNERRRAVEVTDRRMRVLLISSGPMRDYQFVRNTLFRHSGIESDVWLQSVTEENVAFVSQEAKNLLTRFPETEAHLFAYDVIVAFDPDWSRLSGEQQTFLNRWVAEHAGGLVVVAGEIFTPQLAQDPDAFRDISVLYPVLLTRMAPDLRLSQRADEPWPIALTDDGRSTEFLRLLDASGNASVDLWKSFKGIYRSYPVRGVRDGAVVLLEYGNPRARTELGQPPFLATQIYGAGRSLFLGSAETWRLREISSQGHQQFWTSLIREAGQGRRSRGTGRGRLLVDRSEVAPGQPVTIRAQIYDARLQPLVADSMPVTITDPFGNTVNVPDRLNPDGRGAGQFAASFRPSKAGAWRISVLVPESTDLLQVVVDVVIPNLESRNPTRNAGVLTELTRDTQGRYLDISEISVLPSLLPDQSQPIVVDEQLRTLWDRRWLLFLMTGLLAFEWIMRRVWRLS